MLRSRRTLDAETSGRGMSMADLDNDGDLDVVVNNLLAPAQIFENQLCNGMGLEVDLFWRESANPYGIGAELLLHTSVGTFTRQVQVASGYLSGDPTRVHFGVPADATLKPSRHPLARRRSFPLVAPTSESTITDST